MRSRFPRWLFPGLPLLLMCCVEGSLPDGYERLYLTREAGPGVVKAAEDLAGLLDRTYGARPDIRPVPVLGRPRGLIIGPAPRHAAFDEDPLSDEILVERTRRGLEIRGSDNTSTQMAVYRFAETFLGWRLYQPGPIGLERLDAPPEAPTVAGEEGTLLLTRAAFYSRNPSPGRLENGSLPDWSSWHGLRERFRYNHTLHQIVPPTRFDTDPDWFAKDADGRPMRPPHYPEPHGYNDHPDLTHPAVRAQAATRTLRALAGALEAGTPPADCWLPPVLRSPGAISTSLSLGDSFVFGEFPPAYPWRPQGSFRRWPDWSNHVFAYTNAVAAEVAEGYAGLTASLVDPPRLYLGALAYLSWENVPDFPVHPAVLPILTYDRTQWFDPQARADDLATVEAWAKKGAPFLGTWDYLFGYGFLIPRSMTRIIGDSIPALHARGVRAYYSQMLPVWGVDGHTTWLLSRLLWDVEASPPALLDEYFHEFYGPAAVPMRAFFDQAEARWMGQEGTGWWLRYWKDPWQVALFRTADLDDMEELLAEAASLATVEETASAPSLLPPGRFRERVQQTTDLFALTRALHSYQSGCWALQATRWEGASAEAIQEGLSLAGATLAVRERLVGTRERILREEPNSRELRDFDWVFRYDDLGASLTALALAARARGLDPAPAASALRHWAGLQGLEVVPEPGSGGRQVLYDRALSEIDNPRIWHHQMVESEGGRFSRLARAGGLLAENIRRGHVYQLFRAQPGAFYLGEVDLETAQSPSGEVTVRLDFFDEAHTWLGESPRARLAPTGDYGEGQRLRALMAAPADAAYGRLRIRFYEMDPGSRAEVTRAGVREFPARETRP